MLAALAASVAVVCAPLEARVAVEQLLLPYSVDAVYVYRAWLGAGRYTVCFHGVSGANITLVWAGGPQAHANTSVKVLSGLGCVTSAYTHSPTIIIVHARVPPYTAHVGELIVSRTGW